MAYAYEQIEHVALVRWSSPTAKDVLELRDLLRSEVRRRGSKIFYVGVVPAGMERLDPAAQKAMMEIMDELMDICSSLHLVFEGEGMRVAMHRMVLVTIIGIRTMGQKRTVDVHQKVSEALSHLHNAELGARVLVRASEQARAA